MPVHPETVLRTERFVLRPWRADDVGAVRAACADAETQRWLPLPRPYTLDDAVEWCTRTAHALRESGDGLHLAVTAADTGRLLGAIGLHRTDWRVGGAEAGWWTAPEARRRGVATEACRALGRWLLRERGFHRMEVRVATGNVASRRVALRAGLRHEGTLRGAGVVTAGRVDLDVLSLLPADLPADLPGGVGAGPVGGPGAG
ncbi:GNAT family N-acetyltransferase [Streptomyces calidiresistens]|uniref:GNAT family N-acetyltransferase n=1 Tax=Streptomyces calidiresistens TaxID=1485586 RepID=A0A7W3T5F1_9ACTN|nr:GNAT family N-acetyltransferase [Streptomyces calidiresistens]MBB0231285.1 GNAT family N-acetyltransferase [Streptomyces calidiresistens]